MNLSNMKKIMNIMYEQLKFYLYLIQFGLFLYFISYMVSGIVDGYYHDVNLYKFCEKSCKNQKFLGISYVDYEKELCFCTKRSDDVIQYIKK